MKNLFTFKKLIASIFMILTAMVMNAQTQVNPWHDVVHDAGGKEVASHSVEIITDVTVFGNEVDFLLDNGNTYSYPITSTFAFDQREGGGTAIATVATPKWNVFYSENALRFTQPVNSVAVYTMSGVLIAKVSGNSTSVPVNLVKGLYIVQANGKAVKLMVTGNGSEGISIQSTVVNATSTQSTTTTTLRAATATFKQYWNINAGDMITPIDIGTVNTFYITTNNTIVFLMKDGNTVQLTNYQGTSFSTQPTTSQNIDWDMANTILYGGATYAWGYGGIFGTPSAITWAAVHKNGLAFHSIITDNTFLEDKRINNSDINQKLWDAGNNSNSRLSAFFGSTATNYGMSYSVSENGVQIMYLVLPTGLTGSVAAAAWSFNNNTNIIPTTFVKDGTKVTMTCVDINGKTWSYTFSTW